MAANSNWLCSEKDQNKDHWYIASLVLGRDAVLRLETYVEGVYGGGVYGREPVTLMPTSIQKELTYRGKTVTLKISKENKNEKYEGKFTFTDFENTHTKSMICERRLSNQ
jgi:hypothetical protein